MFIETSGISPRGGCIEVICGCMFSGKTEELIRRVKRAQIANRNVGIFKPYSDTRYSDSDIVSHNDTRIPSGRVQSAQDIVNLAGNFDVIGIDEAQFFDAALPDSIRQLAAQGRRIILAGLDLDSGGNPFGPMPALMSMADFVTKTHAICSRCGDLARYTFRKANTSELLLIGGSESYEARCRVCFHLES